MDIRIRELSVFFAGRRVQALRDITVSIRSGERVAILGPSGAGKSTLLRAILGAFPSTGSIRVGGLDPDGAASDRRAIRIHTGFLRQGGDLVPGMSGRFNALLGTAPTWHLRDWVRVLRGGVPDRYADRLDELASRHDIIDCLPAKVEQLSGGQRQRVALVRALLGRPHLLLADEPTAGLDPVTGRTAVDSLYDAEAATVVIATHDLAAARRFPRVLALHEGRVVHDDTGIDDDAARRIYGPVPAGPALP